MAEQKAVCGGFIVGEGLEMNGKVLSATGDSGTKYIDFLTYDFASVTSETSVTDLCDMVKNGENVAIRLTFREMADTIYYLPLACGVFANYTLLHFHIRTNLSGSYEDIEISADTSSGQYSITKV